MSAHRPSAPSTVLALALSALVGTAAVVASVRTPNSSPDAAASVAAPAVAEAASVDPSVPSATSIVGDDATAGEPAPTF
jgi:hypothetical protein